MKIKAKILLLYFLTFIFLNGCLDPYNPPSTQQNFNYLVVDGFLNATDKSCAIKLSRTFPLTVTQIPQVTDASVQLIDENNVSIELLQSTELGTYEATNLNLDLAKKYKLRILTNDNEYQSDLVSIYTSPPIDSISWEAEANGVPVYISSHDASNNTHYYLWKFTETWAYSSKYPSFQQYLNDEIVTLYEDRYHCWKTLPSTNILLGSSDKLDEDRISELKLTYIPWESPRLQIRYSILVEQHALSKGAFEYLQQIKKNTENLGTLFDPLPSNIIGNIKCVTNAKEQAIGYFTACTTEKKRKYIDFKEVSPLRPKNRFIITGYEDCQLDSILLSEKNPTNTDYIISEIEDGPKVIGYMTSTQSCCDCRIRISGGTNIQPDFWEE